MPPVKKPAASARRVRTSKEPAALRRLTKSLDAAHEALSELRKDTGRDASQGARDVYKDLRTFVSSARRDTGKLAKALARDLEQAEKQLVQRSSTGATRSKAPTSRRRSPSAASKPAARRSSAN
jgi:septation ring formation regulator EzrA